jgi:tetratricopeptide (TPR) repeat protein
MYRSSWFLAAALLGTNVAVVQQVAGAKSAVEVGRIAKAITVEIKAIGSTDIGSGILLQRQGDVYTVLTSGHVANKSAAFTIKTADGQVQQAIAGSIRLASNSIDLGIMKFRSSNNYTVAKIGTSNSLEELSPIYVAGFPERTRLIEAGTLNITEGKVKGKANWGNSMGYSLIYSNDTYYGMSGGPVLNSEGELVAIHGQGEREENSERKDERGRPIKTDRNLGITIERFGSVALAMGIQLDQKIAALPQSQPLNAFDYLLAGLDKSKKGDYKGALVDYSQAISINPKYSKAYAYRGDLRAFFLEDLEGAMSDYNQAILIDPKDPDNYINRGYFQQMKIAQSNALSDYNQAIALSPKYFRSYIYRGELKQIQQDYKGAESDYNQAIALEPRSSQAYMSRAGLKQQTKNFTGALADYNQLISIDSKRSDVYSAYLYYLRANLKAKFLSDFKGALADYNESIILAPKKKSYYAARAKLKESKLNDLQGALADYNQLIAIYPKDTFYYYRRAELKVNKLKDLQGGLADYDQAIAIDPGDPSAYYDRGMLKYFKLKDKASGIQDLRLAVKLYRKREEIDEAQKIISILQKLGVKY